ncbi:MAG TPA: U32 family peptidase [Candidatus Intestinimonas merdavium]|uniref:U32 family peptidase n=1 Tax=Candidatus Intestinimonas merdavium TaxID=2838622 RepID=A0A9D1Z6A1_9FIRM|nr:U32 family peptidase [Candidatus Intestinimonas merdavium]
MSIELLAPAGDMERLRMAVAYGADAVYLAGSDFGMRAFAGNFDRKGLREAVELCHSRGVHVHVTCNTMPRCEEVDRLPEWLEHLDAVGVDAAIVADLGVFRMAQKYAPHLQLHVSTQAGVTNHAVAQAWYELGASRVILARELSLEEIRTIRDRTPRELEIEAFVHGAMCVSYSGRCLLSNYMTGRDAQRGMCAQPCRYKYALVEEKRPGEYFPIFEENNETFIMNSRDMCMIDHLPDLVEAGLNSLKIEGRAKSAYYAAVVTSAYRHGLDAALAGEPLAPIWRSELDKVSHRPYSTGFYYGPPGQYTGDARYIRDYQVCAMVETCAADGTAVLSLRNKFAAGAQVELLSPGLEPMTFLAPEMKDMDGLPLLEPKKPEMRFQMRLPRAVKPLSILRRQVDLSPQ